MLYQEVRPGKLKDVVGNKSTVKSLQAILKKPDSKRPHAFLFSGPSGCGKTTLARILVSEFGCVKESIIEMNAANTRGIDSIRQVIQEASMTSVFAGAKAYIFDESHQITKTAQEALLKVIEDCPKDCYFIFCTTEPQNIIKTIRNRCAEYTVSKLNRREIKELVEKAISLLDIPISDDLIEAICLTSKGSPRATLVSLEKIIGLDEEEALELLVEGSEQDNTIFDLCNLLKLGPTARTKNYKKIFKAYDGLKGEPDQLRRSMLGVLSSAFSRSQSPKEMHQIAEVMSILSKPAYNGKADIQVMLSLICFGGFSEEE